MTYKNLNFVFTQGVFSEKSYWTVKTIFATRVGIK